MKNEIIHVTKEKAEIIRKNAIQDANTYFAEIDGFSIYEYDVFNRNTKVETFSGNIQINRYDVEGLRYKIEENGKLVFFIFRESEVVLEESQEDKVRYIRTNVLLTSNAESTRTYYHYAPDEMGNVVDNEAEEILNQYRYNV